MKNSHSYFLWFCFQEIVDLFFPPKINQFKKTEFFFKKDRNMNIFKKSGNNSFFDCENKNENESERWHQCHFFWHQQQNVLKHLWLPGKFRERNGTLFFPALLLSLSISSLCLSFFSFLGSALLWRQRICHQFTTTLLKTSRGSQTH